MFFSGENKNIGNLAQVFFVTNSTSGRAHLKSVFKEGGTAPYVRNCAGKLESRSSVATCRWRLFHINLYLCSPFWFNIEQIIWQLWSQSTWITVNVCFSRKLIFELIRGIHPGTTLLKPALKNSLCPKLFSEAFLRFDSLFLHPTVEEAPFQSMLMRRCSGRWIGCWLRVFTSTNFCSRVFSDESPCLPV